MKANSLGYLLLKSPVPHIMLGYFLIPKPECLCAPFNIFYSNRPSLNKDLNLRWGMVFMFIWHQEPERIFIYTANFFAFRHLCTVCHGVNSLFENGLKAVLNQRPEKTLNVLSFYKIKLCFIAQLRCWNAYCFWNWNQQEIPLEFINGRGETLY